RLRQGPSPLSSPRLRPRAAKRQRRVRGVIETIDLDRHGVIEASAGTGKTYTLEKLVLRLLRERPVSLEQILLVTFTEKATGELKGRLRQALERECADKREHRERF